MNVDKEERVESILTLLMELAGGNLAARCEHSGTGDELDAIVESINMLAEELEDTFKNLEAANQRLLRAEKLTVLGQLCGGVAHELRNPLGALKNAAFFLNMALENPDPEIKETLGIINAEVSNSERIIVNLLDFARPKDAGQTKVDLAELLRQVLAGTAIPGHVEVSLLPDEDLPVILADPDQLSQAFGNLIRNACQAMPERAGPGRLEIRVGQAGQEAVRLTFADSGEGIDEEHLATIFEPLFTTKAKGIGLGLAVTQTVFEKHGGTIEARNGPLGGAEFEVILPRRPTGES